MKTLVIGLGMGQLYARTLTQLGHEVITIDTDQSKQATFANLDTALYAHPQLNAVFICTPNYTHDTIAQKVATHTKMVFVEKPGVLNAKRWQTLQLTYPQTRFIMIKNNMWRTWEEEFHIRTEAAEVIHINWINRDRVPAPGSWFTTKKLSFGGVSRDLMPHLLSIFINMNPNHYKEFKIESNVVKQNWKLDQLNSTEYGTVNLNGTYDVDDWNEITLTDGKKKYILTADWRSMNTDDRAIHCYQREKLVKSFELGLCPESVYATMIQNVFDNMNNEEFWNQHKEYDVWIQEKINEKSTNTIH
jgi:predicted dehydrogenase